MTTLHGIDREIRRLTAEHPQARPFLCPGSPIGCEVAEVGIHPGINIPFWPYWDAHSGCDKQGWLSSCPRKRGHFPPTRDRIEVLVHGLAPLRLLELNIYPYYSESLATLPPEYRDTALFEYLLRVTRPRLLLVHGAEPAKHLVALLGVSLPTGEFRSAGYQGVPIEVYRAERNFARGVSRERVREIANKIKKHLAGT